MADISVLARLLNGAMRNVDLASNTPVVLSIKVGGGVSNTELTKAILDNLITLQNGSDVAASLHHHDGRYFTETELGSSSASSGSDLIGDDDTYANFTPAAATVKGALSGIDTALANVADEKIKISANDTTSGYLEDKVVVSHGTNSANPLEISTLNDGSNEDLQIQFDQTKVDHGSLAGLGDDDHTIYTKADGTRAFTGNQSMGGNRLTNVADPVSDQDVVTKNYLDLRENGLKPKQAVKWAISVNVDISTELENGDAPGGIGSPLVTGDRILLYGQTNAAQNGIYIVPASGAASRAPDFDSLSPIDEVNRAWVPVMWGDDAGKVFVQYEIVNTLGTDPVRFEYYNALTSLIGGDGVTMSGNTLSLDLLTNGGLKSSNPGNDAGQLQISLEASNPSLEINGSNELKAKLDPAGAIVSGASGLATQVDNSTVEIATNALQVKAAGIDENHLNSSVAGDGLSGGAGSALSVNVDNSTIEINTDALRVKAAGINENHIASSSLGSGLSGGSGTVLSVASAPKVADASGVAGESFSSSTLYAVRYGQDAETAGRMYKADNDASSTDNFYVVGLMFTTGILSAGDSAYPIVKNGFITATSHGLTVGKPVYLSTGGILTSTAPTAANTAIVRVGMVKDANTIDVQIQVVGVN